mmetsp:Transcript_11260/g.18652  ORF Transcript_11260/g.18652 Transcript_11260/m.18652 type:complete len:208 (-) Transcript_11260:831-1454(-)
MGCTQSNEEQPPVVETLNNNKGTNSSTVSSYPLVGPEKIMSRKGHGTYSKPVQGNLRYGCDFKTADRICNYNRHFAERAGYFTSGRCKTEFLDAVKKAKKNKEQITFYDSNTGKPLFTAPVGRTWDAWLKESKEHGWPSFRDAEVNWDYMRCLKNGESVSVNGTHLGHNLPDGTGNRYCINLVSIAGNPVAEEKPPEQAKITAVQQQ